MESFGGSVVKLALQLTVQAMPYRESTSSARAEMQASSVLLKKLFKCSLLLFFSCWLLTDYLNWKRLTFSFFFYYWVVLITQSPFYLTEIQNLFLFQLKFQSAGNNYAEFSWLFTGHTCLWLNAFRLSLCCESKPPAINQNFCSVSTCSKALQVI